MSRIDRLFQLLFSWLPEKYILFESKPAFSDNTRAVFEELLRRGLNEKYGFVWLCSGERRRMKAIKNVLFLYPYSHFWDKLLSKYMLCRARLVICCNHYLLPLNAAPVFFLGHGTTIKDVGSYYTPPDRVRFFLGASKEASDLTARVLGASRDSVVALGFPRNDELTLEPLDLHLYFPDHEFDKLIVWYPTFRQHTRGRKTGSSHSLPVIWDEKRAEELNACAKEHGVLLIIKPHFAQDVSVIKTLNLSNLVFIDDDFFTKFNLTSYRFVGSCDALLTDYSSIYYDYTLCDRPIGLIWEDYEEYAQNPGFAVDMDDVMKGGEKIYTLDELKGFVCSVAAGEDHLRNERREIRDRFNISTDGKNTERVVNYIVDVFGL